jgi:hypothetical protein
MMRIRPLGIVALLLLTALTALPAVAQTCTTPQDMDPATKSSIENAAVQIFNAAASNNTSTLQNLLAPSLNAASISSAIAENRADLTGATPSVRGVYLLDATGVSGQQKVEFYCGVVNSSMYTGFQLNGLAPGKYAYALVDGKGGKGPIMFSQILQDMGGQWKLGGFVLRPASLGGHDGFWYLDKARQFKSRGQAMDAWFYYLTAWRLIAPVDFMSSPNVDKLSSEVQAARTVELPTQEKPISLSVNGKTYQLSDMFVVPENDTLNFVVKYQVPSIADRRQTFEDNMAVIRAIVAKYPELRDAFAAVVARAVAPNGEDYGSLLAMKDVK